MSETYLVAIKPSAWQRSRPVGEWVNREGPRRAFASKALAKQWARDCAGHGVALWVQDAPAWDRSSADGYLVGGARAARPHEPSSSIQQSLDATTDNPD